VGTGKSGKYALMGVAPPGRGNLRDRQGTWDASGPGPPVAMQTPGPQANSSDRTGEHTRPLGRAKPLRGEALGHVCIGVARGLQAQPLGFHLGKAREVAQRAHGARHLQLTDRTTPPHNAGGDRIGRAALQHHLLEEAAQERLARRAAHGVLVPEHGQRVPQRAKGLAQRGWNRHSHGFLRRGAETRVVLLGLL
jgi:hypothetical protein